MSCLAVDKKIKTGLCSVVTLPAVIRVVTEIFIRLEYWWYQIEVILSSSTNVNVNLTDEEKWSQLPAICFIVYRTDYIFALHVYVLFNFFFNGLMIIF